jgi:predicted membrane protein
MSSERPPLDRLASGRLVVGLLVIALGFIFLAGNLGWFSARHVLGNAWPLFMVAVGVSMLNRSHISSQGRRARPWGWVFVTIGLWLFLDRLGWVSVTIWQVFMPAVLLFAGGMLVWRSLQGPKGLRENEAQQPIDDHAEFVNSFAFMSGSELRPVSRPFRGADLSAVMAGIKLDLTGARMEGDIATVEVFAFWSGIEIYVPPDWTVSSKVTTLMAGFIDKRRPTSVVPTKTLVITGFVMMAGIEVKN